MSLADEIKRVLKENPSIIVDALMQKPEILYEVLAKLMPWQVLVSSVEDLKREVEGVKKEVEEIKSNMVTKQEFEEFKKTVLTKEDAKNFVTKDEFQKEIKRLETTITALGARWGLMSEEAFREGIYEIISKEGFNVSREILYDKQGEVYGEPSDVEYDLIIKDHEILMVEITSSLKRGDLPIIKKKKEFYEKEKKVKISGIVIITPFIHDKYPDRDKAMAKDMGIDIVYPIPS